MPGTRLLALLGLMLAVNGAVAQASPHSSPSAGESMFRLGVLPSGEPLVGTRDQSTRVTGADAACAKCHRRSGLGSAEGRVIIPPITGEFLFQMRGRESAKTDLRTTSGFIPNRKPYDAASVGRAIRDGVDVNGRQLSYLMPRYKLDDASLAVMVRYLQEFASAPVPGTDEDTLQFATIITPDADPSARQGMLDVLNQFFTDKNEFIRGGIKPMQTAGGVRYRVSRRWNLHVWELRGPSSDWRTQLDAKLRAEPVFAVISGIGGATWAPVHEFCEANHVPCLFPNVDLPVAAESDFYSMYFYKGVLLEAQLLADLLPDATSTANRGRLIQVYRESDIGGAAARLLAEAAKRRNPSVQVLNLPIDSRPLREALRQVKAGDTLTLWLRPADLKVLAAETPPVASVYVSGVMAGAETAPLPEAWRKSIRMTYPFDLPDKRQFRMNYPLAWMKIKHVPLVNERVQSNTYLACGIMAEQLTSMQDSFVREYLLERIEDMLSHRVLTGFYPRLGLAPGQRFASKGGYLVHFVGPTGTVIAPDTDWTVP